MSLILAQGERYNSALDMRAERKDGFFFTKYWKRIQWRTGAKYSCIVICKFGIKRQYTGKSIER